MKEFLLYIHAQLSRIAGLHKASEKISNEDNDLLESIRQTVMILEEYAGQSKNGELLGILDDLEYSIRHMWVTFKAEAALEDAKTNINKFKENIT